MTEKDLANAQTTTNEFLNGESGINSSNNYAASMTNPREYSYDLNGQKVKVNFGRNNNVGTNMDISIGNETYKVQLGKDISNMYSQDAINSIQVGQLFKLTLNGEERMAIKDTDNKIRIVAARGSGSGVGFNRVLSRIMNTYLTYGLGSISANQTSNLKQAFENANSQ